MQYNRILVRSLIILMVSVICLVNSVTAAVQDRPFKGRIVGQFVATPTGDPIIFHSVANASGNATYVGRFTKVTSDTFNLPTGAVTEAGSVEAMEFEDKAVAIDLPEGRSGSSYDGKVRAVRSTLCRCLVIVGLV